MENEKDEEEKPKATPSAEESFARIASGVSDIRTAVLLTAFLVMLNQCGGAFKEKSEESKALWSISHDLRTIGVKLESMDGPDSGVQWQLRELNKSLSNINSTIWEKSCSR